MANVKVKGFVLRVAVVGESDRILDILTAEHGLICASARGARRTKSPLLMATQIFTLSDFELFVNKGHYYVNAAELREAFLPLQQDLDRLVCAAHLAEVMLDSMRDDVAQPDLYRLWAYSVHALQSLPDPLLQVHIAQMRLLAEIGLAPMTDACVVCGGELQSEQYFSIQSCGIICRKVSCRQKAGPIKILPNQTLDLLRYIIAAPLSRLFNLSISTAVRESFIEISADYLAHQMEKSYQRLKLLSDLDKLDDQTPDSSS